MKMQTTYRTYAIGSTKVNLMNRTIPPDLLKDIVRSTIEIKKGAAVIAKGTPNELKNSRNRSLENFVGHDLHYNEREWGMQE